VELTGAVELTDLATSAMAAASEAKLSAGSSASQ
jgi:hypothetical protein